MKRLIIPLILLLIFVTIIAAQEGDNASPLILSVAGEECTLNLIEIDTESTPEPCVGNAPCGIPPQWLPQLPTYTVGDDCEDLLPLLTVASNGTLWLALLLDDNNDDWLQLSTIEDDPHPPQLDGRGRYFGCHISDEGQQSCYVLAEWNDETVLVTVPVYVGDAYVAPQPVETEEPETPEGQTGDNQPPQDNGNNQPQPTQALQPTNVPPTPPDGQG